MDKKEWLHQVKLWKMKYPPPIIKSGKKDGDPTKVKICCAVCGESKRWLERHHKANDYMFAMLKPELFAARYVRFSKRDVDMICFRCHRSYHEDSGIGTLKLQFWAGWNKMTEAGLPETKLSKYLKETRKMFLSNYNDWKKREKTKYGK